MRHSRTMLTAVAAMLSVSLAGVVDAQGQPRARRTPPMGQPGAGAPSGARDGAPDGASRNRGPDAGPRMRAGNGSPASALLRLRGPLSLTDDQVKRLEALEGANVPRRNIADDLRARADLLDATRGDGDLTAARAAMDRMHKLRTDRAIAQLKQRQDARAVLTAEQKTRLDNFRSAEGRRQRMVASGRGPTFGRGSMGPGARAEARGRGFMPPRERMPQGGMPGMPGMRQRLGPPAGGQMGPGPGMRQRMWRGGELDSAAASGMEGRGLAG